MKRMLASVLVICMVLSCTAALALSNKVSYWFNNETAMKNLCNDVLKEMIEYGEISKRDQLEMAFGYGAYVGTANDLICFGFLYTHNGQEKLCIVEYDPQWDCVVWVEYTDRSWDYAESYLGSRYSYLRRVPVYAPSK